MYRPSLTLRFIAFIIVLHVDVDVDVDVDVKGTAVKKLSEVVAHNDPFNSLQH